jgi:hypothetical protein
MQKARGSNSLSSVTFLIFVRSISLSPRPQLVRRRVRRPLLLPRRPGWRPAGPPARRGRPGGVRRDPLRRPGGFDGVAVAQVQQWAVWRAADIGAVDGAEGGEGLVPGGSLVGVARYRFGSDRLGGMAVAGQFPARANRAGPPLPLKLVQRLIGAPTGPSAPTEIAQGVRAAPLGRQALPSPCGPRPDGTRVMPGPTSRRGAAWSGRSG